MATMITRALIVVLAIGLAASRTAAQEDADTLLTDLRRKRIPVVLEQGRIVEVDLSNHQGVTDWIDRLRVVDSLRGIDLSRSSVSDNDMALLTNIEKLSMLDVSHTQISNQGAEELTHCSNLTHLNVSWTKINARAVVSLTHLETLRSLSLAGIQLRDVPINDATKWTELRELDLSYTSIGDETLSSLAPLSKMQRLHLAKTALTDRGLRHLRGMKAMKWLVLDGTNISDVGLEHLLPLNQLETISAKNTNVTSGAIAFHARLRGKHPGQLEHPLIFRKGWPVLETKGWIQKNAGQEEMVFTASLEEVQILRNPQGRIYRVLNTPAFCVLFEDVHDPLREVWSVYCFHVWLRPPSAEERRAYASLGNSDVARSYWPQRYSKDWTEVSYQYPTDSAAPVFSHKIQIKTDLTQVIIDGNEFDLRYDKKYIVIDNRGKAREVAIP